MLSRQRFPSGSLKSQICSNGLFTAQRRSFRGQQCLSADSPSSDRPPAIPRTRREASAAAARDIQNLRQTVDLRNKGITKVPTGAPVVRPSLAREATVRGGRPQGKLVRRQREGGDRVVTDSAANRANARPRPSRSPRDAPFEYGPRRVNLYDGPGDSSFKGRSRQSALASSRGLGNLDDKQEDDDDEEETSNEYLDDEASAADARDNVDLLGDEVDGDEDLDLEDMPQDEEEVLDDMLSAVPDNEPWLTEEEQEETINQDDWVRLECATMPPVHEALPTFKPAEVSVESLLQGRATLPVGVQGIDQVVDLQLKRASKRGDASATNYDWQRDRFQKGHLVSFDSQEEMEWALYRRNWESKAQKIITGQEVAFKDSAERQAVSNIITEQVIKSVQGRHPELQISTKEELERTGVPLADIELQSLNRLAVLAKEDHLPKDPEQAEIMRSLLGIPALSDEERKSIDQRYSEFVPVQKEVRNNVMGKIVGGKYSIGDEKGITASIQRLTVNNGSYLPNQQKSLLERVKSYLPSPKQ